MFRDEPEERPTMFRDEPEERPRAAVKRPAAPVAIDMKRNRRFTPFGDEPEEMEGRAPSSSSKPARTSSCAVPEDADDDGEDGPAVKIFSINWSGMKLFSQASFLKNVQNASGTTTPKRPYDNTKRAANARPTSHQSHKSVALDPKRLDSLQRKSQCKCFLNAFKF